MIAPKPSRESSVEDDHFFTEQAIAASPVSWTFLRHALYPDTLWSLPRALAAGTWATATADQPRHWVSREDRTRADAAVLASGDTSRTGPTTSPARPRRGPRRSPPWWPR